MLHRPAVTVFLVATLLPPLPLVAQSKPTDQSPVSDSPLRLILGEGPPTAQPQLRFQGDGQLPRGISQIEADGTATVGPSPLHAPWNRRR